MASSWVLELTLWDKGRGYIQSQRTTMGEQPHGSSSSRKVLAIWVAGGAFCSWRSLKNSSAKGLSGAGCWKDGASWGSLLRIYPGSFTDAPCHPYQWSSLDASLSLEQQHRKVGQVRTLESHSPGIHPQLVPSCRTSLGRFLKCLRAPLPSSVNLGQGPPSTTYLRGYCEN